VWGWIGGGGENKVEDNGISSLGGLKDRFATFGTPKDGLFHGLFVNPIEADTTKQKNAGVVLNS